MPAAVEKTVAAVSKDATIKALSDETQNGKTAYVGRTGGSRENS